MLQARQSQFYLKIARSKNGSRFLQRIISAWGADDDGEGWGGLGVLTRGRINHLSRPSTRLSFCPSPDSYVYIVIIIIIALDICSILASADANQ